MCGHYIEAKRDTVYGRELPRRHSFVTVYETRRRTAPSRPSSLCLSQRSSSAASAAREAFFQPKDLVWLDSCDKHRNEGPRYAATTSKRSGTLYTGVTRDLSCRLAIFTVYETRRRTAPSLPSSLCLSQRSSSAASAAREAFFQPKDLVWLDSCDKHRNEGPRYAATTSKRSGTLYTGGSFRAALLSSRFMKRAEGPHPLYPHPCARHRDPAAPRLRRGKRSFSPRTWSDWIPVTSTGMRRSNKTNRCGNPESKLAFVRALARKVWRFSARKRVVSESYNVSLFQWHSETL
ncbi:hypothetical protein KGO5_04384 [Sinorhizobium sp. KGO-5]|nr:hypothetical protein KGO5_04384 [Sinorhizobium sp. KGO-5]